MNNSIHNRTATRNAGGFTMIEIAVVLVVIGLLLGGVLKGQAMIENAKTRKLLQDFRSYKVAHMAYFDRTGVYPGSKKPPASENFFADLIDEGFLKAVSAEDKDYTGHTFDGDTVPHVFDSVFSHWIRGGVEAVKFHVLCAEGMPESVANFIVRNQNGGEVGDLVVITNMAQQLTRAHPDYFKYENASTLDSTNGATAICHKLSRAHTSP